MKFKKSKFLFGLLSSLLVFFLLVLFSYFSFFFSNFISGMSVVDSVVSVPFQFSSNFVNGIRQSSEIFQENQVLKEKIYSLEENEETISNLKSENEELRSLLNLQSSITSLNKVTAKVINRNTVSWSDQLTISAGKVNGVSDNMLVIGNGGLVGFISDLSDRSSQVTLLTNEKLSKRITVKISTSSGEVFAILTGFDSKEGTFLLTELNSDFSITEGDEVLTSGLGDYPVAGLPVGEVLSVKESSNLLSKEVTVKPAANFSTLQFVTVLGDE